MTYPNDPNQPPHSGDYGGDPYGRQYPPQNPQPQYPQPPYPPQYPQPQYPQYGQPAPYGYGGYPQQPPSGTNGMAIASLITSCAGLVLCTLACPVGAVLGHVALGRIRQTGQDGRGLALAGVIVGWLGTVLLVVLAIFLIVAIDDYYYYYYS